MEEQEYLEQGFDPSTLTVPRLRSILVAHSISYPSSAKKSQLIDLFNSEVVPQARKLRASNARVKRSSRGIEDVTPVKGEQSEEEQVHVKSSRTPRRTTRARTEEVEELPLARSMRHSTAPPEPTPRRASSKHGRGDDLPSEPESKRPAGRKTKPSTPSFKQEEEATSPFSDNNVFQSGSSPEAPPPSERRRTTMNTKRLSNHSQHREPRRRIEDPRQFTSPNDGVVVPSRSTFEIPARIKHEEFDDLEPTEEFTPEEQQALVTQSNALAPVRRHRKAAGGGTIKTGITSILTVLSAAAGYLWSEEKFKVGYCGVGHPSMEIHGVEIPDWADSIRPICEPCPPHAYCHDNLRTVCEPGFVLTQHPLSVGGLLPFAPTCEADSARARKVKAVKDRAVEELREQNAKYECGEASKPEVKETDLKRSIATMRRRDMSNEEFEDLWASALGEMRAVEEITSGADGVGDSTFRSTSLARVPISCAIRRSILETIRRHVWIIVVLFSVLSSGLYGQHKITSSRSLEAKAKELASLALDKLSEQASLHAVDPDRWPEGYISVAQLRDDVLRNEFSSTRRKKIWERVQKKVEGNSNVRPMVREGRGGDIGRVWDWVGAIGAIEATPATDRRRSSFYDSSLAGSRMLELSPAEKTTSSKVVRWQEPGGQYY